MFPFSRRSIHSDYFVAEFAWSLNTTPITQPFLVAAQTILFDFLGCFVSRQDLYEAETFSTNQQVHIYQTGEKLL
jgi:hypothetical protein